MILMNNLSSQMGKYLILFSHLLMVCVVAQMTNCKTMKVVDYFNPTQFKDICVACTSENTVLSHDFQACIPTINKLDLDQNCLQFSKNGSCKQMRGNNQIIVDQNGNVSQITPDQSQLSFCAVKMSGSQECIFPVFPYKMDTNTKTITFDNVKFCALIKNNICIQYHYGFINVEDSDYSMFLFNFRNYDQIASYTYPQTGSQLSCKQGYVITTEGCILTNNVIEIQNCNVQRGDYCLTCQQGYTISNDSRSCTQIVLENCSRYQKIRGIITCLECNFQYSLYEGELYAGRCIKRALQQHLPQKKFCQSPYFSQYCELIYPTIIQECGVNSESAECVQCRDNENTYYDKKLFKCQPRQYSKFCMIKNPINDQCLIEFCQPGYTYDGSVVYEMNKQNWVFFNAKDTYYGDNQLAYTQIGKQECKEAFINNCETYQTYVQKSQCKKCKAGFWILQNNDVQTCSNQIELFPAIDNCLTFSEDRKVCLQCNTKYFLNLTTNKCELGESPDGCLIYSYSIGSNMVCKQCKQGFNKFLNSNKCFDESLCEVQGGLCKRCKQLVNKFIIQVGDICQVTKKTCLISTNNICTKCPSYFAQYNGICVNYVSFDDKFSNCEQIISENSIYKCSLCKDDYFSLQQSDNTCQIQHLLNNPQNLTKCPLQSGYYNKQCGTCPQQKCQECIEGMCLSCQPDYFMNQQFKCVYKCPNGSIKDDKADCCSIPNCSLCNDQKSSCLSCANDYFPSNGGCIKACPNQYIKDNQCVGACALPNFYKQESIFLNNQYTTQLFCMSVCDDFTHYDQPQLCTKQCNANEVLDLTKKICYPCNVKNCKMCLLDNKDKCDACSDGYIKTSTNQCLYVCQNLEIVDNPSNCSQCPLPNCYQCGMNNIQCQNCSYTYYFDDKHQCHCPKDGFYEISDTARLCLKCMSNCSQCNSSDTCLKCSNGYFLWNNQCLQNCPVGYYKDNNECKLCQVQNCSACDSQYNCNSCKQGYQNQSIQVNENVYQQKCLFICQNGSYKDLQEQCATCLTSRCSLCTNGTSECLQCEQGYRLFNGICQFRCANGTYKDRAEECCKYDYCIDCSQGDNTKCITCRDSYFLNDTFNCVKECPNQYFIQDQNIYGTCANECPADYKFYKDQIITVQNVTKVQKMCITACGQYTHATNPKLCSEKCFDNENADEKNKLCYPCEVNNCQRCVSQVEKNKCEICKAPYIKLSDFSCGYICQNQQIVSNINDCSTCTINNCLQCQDNNTCNLCMNNYQLQNGKCICPQTGYYEMNNPAKVCLSCSANCSKCNSQEKCLECNTNYYLQNDYCYFKCPEGTYQSGKECKPCSSSCKICQSQTMCQTCQNGYQMEIYQLDGNTQGQRCLFKCQNGSKKENSSQCQTCKDYFCVLCSDSNSCLRCTQGYVQNKDGYCVPKDNVYQCSSTANCKACNDNSVCIECTEGYALYQNRCLFKCQDGTFVTQQQQCGIITSCDLSLCQKCHDTYPTQCYSCKQGSYLLNGACLSQCPNGYFLQSPTGTCEKCNEKCLQCNGSSDQNCISCKSNQANSDQNCSCPEGTFFEGDSCVDKCPLYSQITGDICKKDCSKGLYPVIDQNRKYCDSVRDDKSSFCQEHLRHIPKIISFLFRNETQSDFMFIATLNQTPIGCYNFVLEGNQNFQLQLQGTEFNNQAIYSANINKIIFDKIDSISCDDKLCSVLFKVFYLTKLKYQFKLNFMIDYQFLISMQAEAHDGYLESEGFCPTCRVPKDKIIDSVSQLYCSYDQICQDNLIKTDKDQTIRIVHTTLDEQYKNLQLVPHQMILQYFDDKLQRNESLYLHNFQYDSSTLGQIVYILPTFGLPSGNLVVISRILLSSGNKNRLLEENSYHSLEESLYPQTIIKIEINKVQSDLTFTIVLSSFLLLFFAFGCFMMKKIKKISHSQQNPMKFEDETEQISQRQDCEKQVCSNKQH